MFERYTERTRRTIFFARSEASKYGSNTIETEHLLLGILHEDKRLGGNLSLTAEESIRSEISKRTPPPKEPTPTSVDLPLSHESKRVLAYGAEESEALTDRVINVDHLILGLLREKDSFAASLLWQHGLEYEAFRRNFAGSATGEHGPVRRSLVRDAARLILREPVEMREPAAPSLQTAIAYLEQLLDNAAKQLDDYSEHDAMQALKRKSWSRKEALGNLADWAMAHQGWLARALTEPRLNTPGYPEEQWASAQQYSTLPWQEVVELWVCVNHLLIHVFRQIPEEKLTTPCRIGIAEPVPLSTLIDRYVEYCEDVLEQILARL